AHAAGLRLRESELNEVVRLWKFVLGVVSVERALLPANVGRQHPLRMRDLQVLSTTAPFCQVLGVRSWVLGSRFSILVSSRRSPTPETQGLRPKTWCAYGKPSVQIEFVCDHAGRSDFHLLVLRDHACGTFLQRLWQGSASGSGRLLYFLWTSAKAQCRCRRLRAGVF